MSKFTIETEELSEGMKNAIDYYFARGQRITISEIAAISQAVSLKRIADIMQNEWLEKKGYSQPVTPR